MSYTIHSKHLRLTPLGKTWQTCPSLKLLARGKVRDLYDIDETSLLFVATDRISAYDCIMKTVRLFALDTREFMQGI
jgi:hypothetical protein